MLQFHCVHCIRTSGLPFLLSFSLGNPSGGKFPTPAFNLGLLIGPKSELLGEILPAIVKAGAGRRRFDEIESVIVLATTPDLGEE